ncbi:ragulator complex protein LAMTOR3 [Gadus chalcogrammus]|uniref:ragulator complex protein LAMTOR3 n=1 Tax=Gadus chalcogrammus TaxID=1042646 RepID=UPI0024C21303|nr:ragulator complex protein LAMTOR3 [Gadus chalcogrammus]
MDELLCIICNTSVAAVANESAPEYVQWPGFLSTLALATDQGSKLGLSKNKSITCYCSTYQIVQLNWLPLVISFIAISSANTGLIISLEKELIPFLEELRQVVETAQSFWSWAWNHCPPHTFS